LVHGSVVLYLWRGGKLLRVFSRNIHGEVSRSSSVRNFIASAEFAPHICSEGCRLPQTAGRPTIPKRRQRFSSVSWMQRIPAGLPVGMPGIAEEMEGAMQQAAQPRRQEKFIFPASFSVLSLP